MVICQNCKTQDFYFKEKKGNFCAYCGKKIQKVRDVKLKFGKYRGRYISTMTKAVEKQYLVWVMNNFEKLDKEIERAIINQIG